MAFYRRQKGLSIETPKRKKSEKGFLGPLGPRADKARKSVKNDDFSSFFRVCGSFSTLFRAFLTPGPRGPGNPFSAFFRSFLVGSPGLGSPERGHPDLFRFVPISPFFSDLFRFAFLVFWNAPICSDLFRFLPIGSVLFSEQIRTNQGNPLLPTPFAIPR